MLLTISYIMINIIISRIKLKSIGDTSILKKVSEITAVSLAALHKMEFCAVTTCVQAVHPLP